MGAGGGVGGILTISDFQRLVGDTVLQVNGNEFTFTAGGTHSIGSNLTIVLQDNNVIIIPEDTTVNLSGTIQNTENPPDQDEGIILIDNSGTLNVQDGGSVELAVTSGNTGIRNSSSNTFNLERGTTLMFDNLAGTGYVNTGTTKIEGRVLFADGIEPGGKGIVLDNLEEGQTSSFIVESTGELIFNTISGVDGRGDGRETFGVDIVNIEGAPNQGVRSFINRGSITANDIFEASDADDSTRCVLLNFAGATDRGGGEAELKNEGSITVNGTISGRAISIENNNTFTVTGNISLNLITSISGAIFIEANFIQESDSVIDFKSIKNEGTGCLLIQDGATTPSTLEQNGNINFSTISNRGKGIEFNFLPGELDIGDGAYIVKNGATLEFGKDGDGVTTGSTGIDLALVAAYTPVFTVEVGGNIEFNEGDDDGTIGIDIPLNARDNVFTNNGTITFNDNLSRNYAVNEDAVVPAESLKYGGTGTYN